MKTIKLSTLKLNDGTHGLPKNPRFIKDDRFKKLCDSIRDFPEAMPARGIVVDENNVILGGNMRFRGCRELGMTEIPASWVHRLAGLTVEQKRRFIIMDNRAFGDDDMDMLANEWDIAELINAGFDEKDLLGVFAEDAPQDAEPQIDKAEELNKKWKVKLGDMFSIGEHRLLCGDSTKAEDVARVMGGGKADMVFTDPPYGVKRADGFGGFDGFGGKGKPIARKKYKGGWDNERPSKECFDIILGLAKKVMIFGGNYFADLLPQGNHWIVWDKKNTMPTFGDCELIWTNIKRDSVKLKQFEYNGLIGKEQERYHATQKPVRLIVDLLNEYEKDGGLITDPFLGSGTTMVACQNLNRKCRGIEISPAYCAVVLDRMATAFPDIKIERVKE